MREVTVRVSATSANLGPGFDCFGCALAMYNTLRFTELDDGLYFEGCASEFCTEDNLAVRAYDAAMARMGLTRRGLRIAINAQIPVSRGLGSSAAMTVAGAAAAAALHGGALSREELLAVCTQIEGHPDNAAPAIYGGFTASVLEDGKPVSVSCPVHPSLSFVALIPPFPLSTHAARAVLPKQVSMQDAVYNASHAALVLRAMESGDGALLRMAMRDRLHQPYRRDLIEGYDEVERLAYACGAAGFCISGAGSTCLCIAGGDGFYEKMRSSMAQAFAQWETVQLAVDTKGVQIL